jgi:hypothetical protein
MLLSFQADIWGKGTNIFLNEQAKKGKPKEKIIFLLVFARLFVPLQPKFIISTSIWQRII